MESTNITAAGRGRGSPLSLNAMPGGRSIIGKRFRNQDLGSFLTKRSASGDDAPVDSIA
uniref:Uncharacterized protein n=1 Tax=Oryza punctata TaxID=4537 RepID=A0A0E0L409_ORYPU